MLSLQDTNKRGKRATGFARFWKSWKAGNKKRFRDFMEMSWNCPSFVLVCKTNFELVTKMVADLVNGELMQLDSSATEDERFAHHLENTFKKFASLIAHSCQSVSVLAVADGTLQSIAFQFGRQNAEWHFNWLMTYSIKQLICAKGWLPLKFCLLRTNFLN